MTHTTNLPSDDPRQRLFAIQDKVLRGEQVSDEELTEAISLLRQTRGAAAERKATAKTAAPQKSLEELLGIKSQEGNS